MNINATILDASAEFIKNHHPEDRISSDFHHREVLRVQVSKIIEFLSFLGIYEKSRASINLDSLNRYNLDPIHSIMLEYLRLEQPAWLSAFKSGINVLESLQSEDKDPIAFYALSLTGIFEDTNSWNAGVEAFFNEAQIIAYKDNEVLRRNNLDTGRRGENLSYQILKHRFSTAPVKKQWLLDNSAGYDLEANKENKRIFVEVKSSVSSLDKAFAIVSNHQIETAIDTIDTTDEFIFHFWSFYENKKYLAEIEVQEVNKVWHKKKPGIIIPEQQIYFHVFKDKFREVN